MEIQIYFEVNAFLKFKRLFNDNESKGEKVRVKIKELKVKVKAANIPI